MVYVEKLVTRRLKTYCTLAVLLPEKFKIVSFGKILDPTKFPILLTPCWLTALSPARSTESTHGSGKLCSDARERVLARTLMLLAVLAEDKLCFAALAITSQKTMSDLAILVCPSKWAKDSMSIEDRPGAMQAPSRSTNSEEVVRLHYEASDHLAADSSELLPVLVACFASGRYT